MNSSERYKATTIDLSFPEISHQEKKKQFFHDKVVKPTMN